MKLKLGILAYEITLYKRYVFYYQYPTALVAMAASSFHRLIMVKVDIGNLCCFIWDNLILFLQKRLLNNSPHFIRLMSELLNLIG